MVSESMTNFVNRLSSSSPVPGGGGASGLVGALGMALGAMVGNLTVGKKKYADVQDEILELLKRAEVLQEDMLGYIAKDAEVFAPLAQAYGLPKTTEEEIAHKEEVLESCLKVACSVPFEIMETAVDCIGLHERFLEIGTKIAISDVGVGILFVKSSLMGASLNVFINTKLMKDRVYAEEVNVKAREMIEKGCARCDCLYEKVLELLN